MVWEVFPTWTDQEYSCTKGSPGSPAAGVTTEEINFQGCLYNREAMFQRALDPPLHVRPKLPGLATAWWQADIWGGETAGRILPNIAGKGLQIAATVHTRTGTSMAIHEQVSSKRVLNG
eukprot:s5546_g1.t1